MASLFNFASPSTPKPKTHVVHGTLPAYIDPRQPPTKRSPWRQILEMPFVRSVSITLPASLYELILSDLVTPDAKASASSGATTATSTEPSIIATVTSTDASTARTATTSSPPIHPSSSTMLTQPPRYFKLLAPMSTFLSPPFFTPFIKTGSVVLLSEGRPGVAPYTAHLHSGVLSISMAREIYERAGLQGRPADRNGGARKHGRDRFVVELDLRRPEMVSGRKGFERLVKAAGGVLGDGKAWVGRDVTAAVEGMGERERVLKELGARVVEMVPEVEEMGNVVVPGLVVRKWVRVQGEKMSEFEDDYHEVVEWLDLVRLGSSRVVKGDEPDPYISRYRVPGGEDGDVADLKVVTWNGLLDSAWCTQLLIELVRRSRRVGCREWLAVTIDSHRTEAVGQIDGCTILFHANELKNGDEDREGPGSDTVMQTEDDTTGGQEPKVSQGGFQHFTCFQSVDTVM